MRVVKEFSHNNIKYSVFSWNEKYLLKAERGPMEITLKFAELDLIGEPDWEELVSKDLESRIEEQLKNLGTIYKDALQKLG
ncbi:hypothetical protein [Marinigracilibium pacificum]|uniref:Uncharacterized protein n=1 Tax=Marinigracilibium pacificum TaxID=2729599 RepID=A0A848J7G1_9BACT|nr:hypothetical protein [Marinigracilibium pacificum]NMM49042.1 hypothetical protein [Marinigracilibium pacificum]